jgi:hypothetical protein
VTRLSFPPRSAAGAALVRAPLPPVALLFALNGIERALAVGPLAIVGAALFAFYVLIAMEIVALVIGGLVLSVIWNRVPFHIVIFMILGGLIACIPFATMLLLPSGNYDAWTNGQATVIDGVKTAYGRMQDLQTAAIVFAFGSIGGASFWWFARRPKNGEERE